MYILAVFLLCLSVVSAGYDYYFVLGQFSFHEAPLICWDHGNQLAQITPSTLEFLATRIPRKQGFWVAPTQEFPRKFFDGQVLEAYDNEKLSVLCERSNESGWGFKYYANNIPGEYKEIGGCIIS